MIDALGWDVDALAKRWAAALPFPHLVFDDLLAPGEVASVRTAFAGEPHHPVGGEVYEFFTSGDPPQQPALLDFLRSLSAGEAGDKLRRITGKALPHLEGRGYVYGEGHYLLPHADYRAGLRRELAFVYYVAGEQLVGGELELFACDLEGGEIVATRSAVLIEPKPNRLVIFDVSPATLHQVREVRRGARASLAGWFSR